MADAAPSAVTIPADARAALVRLLRAAYPHRTFPGGPYERTADAVIARVAGSVHQGLSLAQGLASLDAAARRLEAGDGQRRFVDLDDGEALTLLRGIEDADFFRIVRSVAVVSLYNDHEVWELLGYEGPSFHLGGYLHRGFDDLDWLPSPRIEEYDGPVELVEVAPQDRPATVPTSGGSR